MTAPPAKKRKMEPDESSSLAPASPAPPPSAKYTCNDLVTLVVGSEKQKLVAYSHRLARTSQYFTTELQKELLEGQARTIHFLDEQVDTVTRYLDYICGEGLPTEHTIT